MILMSRCRLGMNASAWLGAFFCLVIGLCAVTVMAQSSRRMGPDPVDGSAVSQPAQPLLFSPLLRRSQATALAVAAEPGPSAPVALVFGVGPGRVYPDSVMIPAVRVQVVDGDGQLRTDLDTTVTLSLAGPNPNGVELSGTTTAPTVDGVAVFDQLRFDRVGVDIELVATTPLGGQAVSRRFFVSDPAGGNGTGIDYDIVYVRAPRYGDDQITKMPEIKDPINVEPGSDLMLLRPDGTEEVLVAAGDGAVLDPVLSYDGRWVFYALVHDQTVLNPQRRNAARSGADLFKIHLETRQVVRLTHQEWTPNTGVGVWSTSLQSAQPAGTNYLGYGIYNLGPMELPSGQIMFTSSRNSYLPNQSFTFPNLQLFVMDGDGKNVELVGHLNLGSALHPTVLTDGRVMFSSYEAQGLRDRRLWALWSIWPDGRQWAPLVSAMKSPNAFHWQTQLSDGSIVVDEYYNQNNNGFGMFLKFSSVVPDGAIAFGSPFSNHESNPAVRTGWFSNGNIQYARYPFSPYGLVSITPFTHPNDNAAPFFEGTGLERTGKVTQPSGAPANKLLLVWSPGPANHLNRPTNRPAYDAGLYLMDGGVPLDDHRNLVLVKNDPNYNEQQPRAVVPYVDIYGIDEPATLPWLPNDGSRHAQLPEGTPYGLVGSSSFYRRDSFPGSGRSEFDGLDPFNTTQNGASSNWGAQGSDAGKYDNSEIYAVRIVALEPTTHLSYGPNSLIGSGSVSNWQNHASERTRILGEIPLRKTDAAGSPVLDANGDPDTSFLAKIPADVPFTFQTIDEDGLLLNAAQTWHQVRPGEARYDCGGCHAHSQEPLDFELTAAAGPNYQILDLANTTPLLTKDAAGQPAVDTLSQGAVDVEYYRDIKPILERSCVQCHAQNGVQEAQLVLDDETLVNGYDRTYYRLARDSGADYGIPPLVRVGSNPVWRQTNASRYIRKFQSRRSLLIWKIFGRRLDGWTNEDHPSAAVPGDATTLPGGGDRNEINRSDLDFVGTIMPPPGSGVPPLSEDEKMMFARWVDLGAPISRPGRDAVGWFADELRPTVAVSSPRAGLSTQPIGVLRVGLFDYYSGLDMATYSVTANFSVNGRSAGVELADLFAQTQDHVWTLSMDEPIRSLQGGQLTVRITDQQGNLMTVERTFDVQAPSAAAVVGRHIFYNNSAFDGRDPAANAADDGAIAPGPGQASEPGLAKRALTPGGTASFENYTSCIHGINGVMVDIDNPADRDGLDENDFQFHVGSGDDPPVWTPAPALAGPITLRQGAGVGGSDRVTIVWPDGAITNRWLRVTVNATDDTGLDEADVFYYGNAIAESGNRHDAATATTTDTHVDFYDVVGVRRHPLHSGAGIDNRYDFNRDGAVNATDFAIARDHQARGAAALNLLIAPTE